jgi:hypothetical protein
MGLYLLSCYFNIITIVREAAVKIYICIYISECKGEVCLGGLKLKRPTSPCTKDLSWHFTYPGPSIHPQIISRLVLCVSARMAGIIRMIIVVSERVFVTINNTRHSGVNISQYGASKSISNFMRNRKMLQPATRLTDRVLETKRLVTLRLWLVSSG